MNVEVEIKVKITNPDKLRKKLSGCDKLKKSIRQIDEYYVPCHRDFFAQKPQPTEWLRLRINQDRVLFEYDKSINKKLDGEQECAEEYETEIFNPKEFRKILEFLDFKKIITVAKNRQYWNCGKFEVALDKVERLGFFIEVEAKTNFFKNNIKAKKECINFLKKLGMKNVEKNHIKKGYPVLLLENKKNN